MTAETASVRPRSLREAIISMSFRRRWGGVNGYRHLLCLGLPMMASNISVSAMLFTNRLFLSHHSLEALAASLPAGVAYLTVTAFFQGLVSYVSVFAAQYTGAGKPRRAGAALGQGLYLSAIAGLLVGLTYFAAPLMFRIGGHPPHIQELEVLYYRILCVPAALNMIFLTLASFLAGLGRTRVVMWVNLAGALVNIPLAYFLIFGLSLGGRQLIAARGVAGAPEAGVISWLVVVIIFSVIVFNRKMEASHGVYRAWKPDFRLFKRLIFYGFPGGFQRFLELGSFTFFAFAVGHLGEVYLATNNIIFSLESLSFFPMLGIGVSVSILVGQSIGRGRPDEAAEAFLSGVGVSTFYVSLIAALFLFFPKPLLGVFLPSDQDPESARQIVDLGVVLLRFVVAYTLVDGLFLCAFGALSGAGDVWFPMIVMGLCGLFALALPIVLLFKLGLAHINLLWLLFVFYILVMNVAVNWRYRRGYWRSRRVIEKG